MLISFLAFQKANATIWRVNNNGFSANFTSLQDANDDNNVINGDTIHVEGSPITYQHAKINKKLIIIGPGYVLNENPNTSNNLLQAQINGGFDFLKGSEGSQLIGVYVGGGTFYGIHIFASDITIKRCRTDYNVYLNDGISDIQIINNFFYNSGQYLTLSAITTSSVGFPADVIFNNNICQRVLIAEYCCNATYTLLECRNNVFDCPAISGEPSIKMLVGSFENNILKTTNATVDINNGNKGKVSYNIGASAAQFGTANNNIVVANMTNLFVDAATNSPDGDYQLKLGSAGSNNGSDGTDRGVFGGTAISNRYTLSGLAPIPVIYKIISSGVTTPAGDINVKIMARTIK